VVEKWNNVTETLTIRLWANWESHRWKSGKYECKHLNSFGKKLGDILNMRTINDQLQRILTVEEQNTFSIDKPFEAFESLDFENTTTNDWKQANYFWQCLIFIT
jgi:hypothetical protein